MAGSDDDPTDGELLAAAARDPNGFGLLYDRHAVAVLRFLYRRTDSAETAADLCAETFAVAFAHRRRFTDTGESARPWLFGIARNLLGHYLRHQKVSERYRRRLGMRELTLSPDELERVEELADIELYREQIKAALAELPTSLRAAIELRIGHDLPYESVAETLGCSVGAARVRVSRGLSRLADLLEEP